MGALSGPVARRAAAALAAGCDVALHCNGRLGEMRRVADAVPPPGEATRDRLNRAIRLRERSRKAVPPLAETVGRLEALLAAG